MWQGYRKWHGVLFNVYLCCSFPGGRSITSQNPMSQARHYFGRPTLPVVFLRSLSWRFRLCQRASFFSNVLDYLFISNYAPGNYPLEEFLEAHERINGDRHLFTGLVLGEFNSPRVFFFSCGFIGRISTQGNLEPQGMKFSPGWSVGFYFIAILGFWKPYQAMKEIWQASKNPSSWQSVEAGSNFAIVVVSFLAESILSSQSLKLSLFPLNVGELRAATVLSIAADVVSVPATIVALILVMKIYTTQMSEMGNGRENESGEFVTELH